MIMSPHADFALQSSKHRNVNLYQMTEDVPRALVVNFCDISASAIWNICFCMSASTSNYNEQVLSKHYSTSNYNAQVPSTLSSRLPSLHASTAYTLVLSASTSVGVGRASPATVCATAVDG